MKTTQPDMATIVVNHIKQMSDQERRQSLVDAGILTQKGNVRNVYKPVFKAGKARKR